MTNIVLSTSKEDVKFTLWGSGRATINWGGRDIRPYDLNGEAIPCHNLYRGVSNAPRTITITGNGITMLDCAKNELTALTLNSTTLMRLGCSINNLKSLDASSCPALESLACSDNELTALNVGGCRRLITLSCHNNALTSLSLTAPRRLPQLPNNPVVEKAAGLTTRLKPFEDFPKIVLPIEKDVYEPIRPDPDIWDMLPDGKRPELVQIPELEESPPMLPFRSEFPNMHYLYCHVNQLTELDVRGCPNLVRLNCSDNNLTSLTIAGLSKLEFMTCYNNNLLPEVNVNGCISLEKINCLSGRRTPFSVTGLTEGNSPLLLYSQGDD